MQEMQEAWRIPWTEELAEVHGASESQTQLND